MVRRMFWIFSILSLILVATVYLVWPPVLWFLIIIIPLILLGIYDIRHTHNILRNYPVIGHIRYMFEFVRPEIQQYFVATNLSGRPFNRELRSLVYQRAKGVNDTHPFGTEHDIDENGYQYAHHSMKVKEVPESEGFHQVGGPQCSQPYFASRLNISAMSFGALSANAVLALNLGAKKGGFAHNTGEGGLSPHHLKHGGDIFWQIGTGYFGCRTPDGKFDEEKFTEKANLDVVKMIEIKISQGAKPSHGGVLPAAKITEEIAEIRGIPLGKDCLSPPTHSEFSTPLELMDYITKLRNLTNGKPIGFKLCIGHATEFMGICKAMLKTGVYPDFITVDGAEGGTGAAPLEYSNRFGMPINEALAFVHNCLVGINLRDKITLIASGKVATGFDVILKTSLGADMCNMARTMMFSIGCIQALKCHENTCPTGVTSQDPARQKAIVPEHKSDHVHRFHDATIKSFLDLTGAMGCTSPKELGPHLVYHRITEGHSLDYTKVFHYIEAGNLLSDNVHHFYKKHWEAASAEHF